MCLLSRLGLGLRGAGKVRAGQRLASSARSCFLHLIVVNDTSPGPERGWRGGIGKGGVALRRL